MGLKEGVDGVLLFLGGGFLRGNSVKTGNTFLEFSKNWGLEGWPDATFGEITPENVDDFLMMRES